MNLKGKFFLARTGIMPGDVIREEIPGPGGRCAETRTDTHTVPDSRKISARNCTTRRSVQNDGDTRLQQRRRVKKGSDRRL